ncbi:hypothetical protein [Actinoplanes derwentensis]|uniref:Uncharacterized protein n=1 Tax=Actinoplanes derwentensis TaxID=113562 RepID=A0A1H2CUP3_9ACTN|nr:hypothetical protein [Actinoplanes derwentensis]GID81982.1 hypothetical protein Ade03nite_09060 [Actinoplanes derwentensis]SDT74270.1 hypothetical protein SAMN04489716_6929 [Actinoplanes derwentensis]
MVDDKQPDNRIQARISNPETAAWLKGRTERMFTPSHHQQAVIELGLWRSALALELRRIRLTVAQASCIADVLTGTAIDATLGGTVYMSLADGFTIARDTPVPDLASYGRKWDVDEKELLEYVGRLSPVADHALRDAIARWWTDEDSEASVEGFAQVGLTVIDPQAPDQQSRLTPPGR